MGAHALDQPRQVSCGKNPGEARDDDHDRDQRGREQDVFERKCRRLLEQRAHLESCYQEQHALDKIDHEVPEEDALQTRCRRDQQRPVPAYVQTAGHG